MDDCIGMMGGGGSDAVAPIAWDESLAILFFVSIGSGFITGACDMTTGCGGGGADEFIIGLICVDPTFIVGAFAGDCCIVLITAEVFNIFAVIESKLYIQLDSPMTNNINISPLCCTMCAPFSMTECRI